MWRERIIEATKKEIIKDAREKAVDLRQNDRLNHSIESQEKLRRIKKLQDLQRNYDYLQKELFSNKNSPSTSIKPLGKAAQEAYDTLHSSLNQSEKSSALHSHLEHLQYLQLRAKQILDKERIAKLSAIPEAPVLNEKMLRKKRQEPVELKIPVYVPLSSIRKEKHLPPTMVNQVLSSGEIMPVYVVGDPTPRYDPLVKINQVIPSESCNKQYRDSVDATAHSNHDLSVDSVFYYRIFKNVKGKKVNESFTPEPIKDLTEAKLDRNARPFTPSGMPYVWMFRELEYDQKKKAIPKRQWVSDRMSKYYEDRVKKDFIPKVSHNKSLELKLNRERQNFHLKQFERVKFL